MAERGESSSDLARVQLTEADIPGAALSDPLERHTVPELRWWLLCRGIQTPKSWKKPQFISRSDKRERERERERERPTSEQWLTCLGAMYKYIQNKQ